MKAYDVVNLICDLELASLKQLKQSTQRALWRAKVERSVIKLLPGGILHTWPASPPVYEEIIPHEPAV